MRTSQSLKCLDYRSIDVTNDNKLPSLLYTYIEVEPEPEPEGISTWAKPQDFPIPQTIPRDQMVNLPNTEQDQPKSAAGMRTSQSLECLDYRSIDVTNNDKLPSLLVH
ncbi:hypothetical protein ACFE04_000405 [Oxalis oulophora]